jgi:hypothetical protein
MNKYVFTAVIAVLLFSYCDRKITSDIVLKVNDQPITRSQVMQVAEIIQQELIRVQPQRAVEGMSSEILKGAARQLIANQVLLREAKTKSIPLDTTRLNTAFKRFRDGFADQASFQRELTKLGETEESVRSRIGEGVMLDSLMKCILGGMDTVTDTECKEFFSKNPQMFINPPGIRISQMVFPVDSAADAATREQIGTGAKRALIEAKKGRAFEEIVKQFTAGAVIAQGGDMGWFNRGDLRPDLESAAFSLKRNEISELLTTATGYHIIKKTDERQGAPRKFDEVKEQIQLRLELMRRNRYMVQYVDSLIAGAQITYLDTAYSPLASPNADAPAP